MKVCTKCKNEIFHGSRCENCTKKYLTIYRQNNKDKIKQLNQQWRFSNKEHYKESKYKYYSSLKGRLVEINRGAKRRSKNRSIDFDLDTQFLLELWNSQNGNCMITGLPLIIKEERSNGKASPFSPSLDRICFNQGYVKTNVRLVCYVVNCGLHDYGIDVFDRIANSLINGIIVDYKTTDSIEPKNIKSAYNKKYAESFKGTVSALYSQCKKHAFEKQISFDISKDIIKNLLKEQTCCITKIPFSYNLFGNKRSNPFRPSIDRIDCTNGYVENNIRVVCVAVNYCLNEFGDVVFKQICEAYLKIKNESNLL